MAPKLPNVRHINWQFWQTMTMAKHHRRPKMPTDPAASPELLSYLEGLPEPHILFDRSYRILGANAAYRDQHGGAAPVIGRTCFDVSHGFEGPCDKAFES